MRRNITIIILILLTSCASSKKEELKANFDLIKPYTYADQKNEKFTEPYVAKYQKKSKQLWFIAADHTDDLESATFKTIKVAMDEFTPEVVIIEGMEYTGELSPQPLVDFINEQAKNNFKGSSESAYTAWLAGKLQIPFVPGEPEDKFLASELTKNGYQILDYYYFDLARVIPQWKRQGKAKNIDEFKLRAPKFMKDYFKNFSSTEVFEFKDFVKWYEAKGKKKFNYSSITSEDFSPQIDDTPSYFNKIAHEVGMLREKHILKIIEMLINNYDRVLITFGAGHLVKERAALKDLLGDSHDEKFY